MSKTNKSILKRIKITKRGKLIHGGAGINHFLAKKRGHKQLDKKRQRPISKVREDAIRSYLYH